MKKNILLILFFLVFFTSINFASASQKGSVYLVEKGDSIYKIAIQVFHIPWSKVKPEARKQHLIYPGDRIALTDLIDSGISSFKKYPILSKKQLARDQKGLKALGLTEREIGKVLSIHIQAATHKKQKGFRWGIIRNGDRFNKVISADFFVQQNTSSSKQVGQLEAARVYHLSNGKQLWYPISNGSWSIKRLPTREIIPLPIKRAERENKKEIIPLPLYPSDTNS